MKKGVRSILPVFLALYILLGACGKQAQFSGHYTALNPPVESGENVIMALTFEGDQVTMISGDMEQTVKYKLQNGQFTILTDFGDFSFPYSEGEDGTLTIDGVDYAKQ